MSNTHPSPAPRKPFYKKIWFIALAAVVVIVAITQAAKGGKDEVAKPAASVTSAPASAEDSQAPAESQAPPAEQQAPPAPEVTADVQTIITAYTDNELAADKEYKGKVVQVSGVMTKVSDVLDQKVLWLGTGEEFELHEVGCRLPESQLDRAASIKKGDQVTVIGKVEGFNQLSVDLDDCTIQ